VKKSSHAGGSSPVGRFTPRIRLFLSTGVMEGVFGSGKWQLLSAVRAQGSLRKAAASLKRSYRKAWGDIQVAEKGLGRPLVARTRGGAGGGAMTLTDFGDALLDAWDRYYREVAAYAAAAYTRRLAKLIETEVRNGCGRKNTTRARCRV